MVQIVKDKDGYLLVRVNKEYYRLSKLLLEFKLKRKLRKDEVCHHIDGNKLNNNFDNLEVKTFEQHSREHSIEKGIKNYPKHYSCECGNKKSFVSKKCQKCYLEQFKPRNKSGRFEIKGGKMDDEME